MKYNEKYGRYFTKGGLVYRYDTKRDKLVLCKQSHNHYGYNVFKGTGKQTYTHRAVYETFVGEIPDGYELDHINTKRDDNRVENLRIVTHTENLNNKLTRKHKSKSQRNKAHSNNVFGMKYIEHFGYSKTENTTQYYKEYAWFKRYGKCRWE